MKLTQKNDVYKIFNNLNELALERIYTTNTNTLYCIAQNVNVFLVSFALNYKKRNIHGKYGDIVYGGTTW